MDRLEQASHRTAAEVERYGALVAGLQTRVAALEAQSEATGTAGAAAADRVEQIAAGLQRVQRIEKMLDELRAEIATTAAESGRLIEVALKAARDSRDRELAKFTRGFDDLGHRMAGLESARDRDDTSRELEKLARDTARIGLRIDALDDRSARIEQAPPRTDPAVAARLEGFGGALVEMERRFDDWQRRIEDQSEIVRQARTVAESMRENVEAIERAHHATAEAQRLAADRSEASLLELREEVAERWKRFETARAHDWKRLERENTSRDSATKDTAVASAELATLIADLRQSIELKLEDEAAAIRELRRDLVRSVRRIQSACSEVLAVAEQGLPETERSDVVDEKRGAAREAFRSQRQERAD
jgi:hypothetical protein